MKLFGYYLNRDRIIFLGVISLLLFGILLYLFIRYSEQIKLMFLIILVGIVFFIFINHSNSPRSFNSPEEESAYRRRKAELHAERDYHDSRRPLSTGLEPGPLTKHLFKKKRK